MDKKKISIPVFAFNLLTCLVSLTSCNEEISIPSPYSGDEFHISIQNNEESINEFNRRLLRYDELSIGDASIPESSFNSFNMGWQVKGLVFQNVTEETFGEDKVTPIYKKFLKTKTQDDYGYIYNQNDFREEPKWAGTASWGTVAGGPQGWTFPTWKEAVEDPFAINSVSDRFFTSYDFNSINDDTNKNWLAKNGSFEVDGTGYGKFASSTSTNESFCFYNDSLNSILSRYGGIVGSQAAFIELDMDFSSKNLDDINLIWQTSDSSSWHKASYKEYVTTQVSSFDSYSSRSYWPMYLNPDWSNKTITGIGVEFVPTTGSKLILTNGKINYLRPSYDTRQPQFAFQWFESFYNYVCFTRDFEALEELMPKARKTMLFFLHCLKGEEGILDLSFFYGHNGIGTSINDDGSVTTHPGNGIASGYWDTLALPEINIESNSYFYTCLEEMVELEKMVETYNLSIPDVSIKNKEIGKERVNYNYSSSSLASLLDKVKERIGGDIKPSKNEDGSYTNVGGLWNPATSRFALGINESNGEIIDHGYVLFNEQAIVAGLGSSSQQESIMSWINGDREVSSDISKGSDIYFYEFAPRFTTSDCINQFNFCLADLNFGPSSALKTYGSLFSRQVQNGGAVIWASYYDLVARAKVLGADNAYSRLEGIMNWYNKVKQNTEGEGTSFFENYYYNEEMYGESSGEGYYVRQAANVDGAGAIGVDSEFLENVIFVRAIPDALFGMEPNSLDLISFTHSIPSKTSYLRADNLRYGNASYCLLETANSMEVTSIKGAVYRDSRIEFSFKQPDSNYKVYVNGNATDEYQVISGYIKVNLPFGKVKVEIK